MKIVLWLNFLFLLSPLKNIDIYFNYGWATFLENIGQPEQAKVILLKEKNKDFFHYLKLGELELTNYDKAIEYFKKAEKINSKNPRLLRDLGKIYFFKFMKGNKGEDLENAKKYLSMYLKIDPEDFLLNYFYGETLKYSGLYREAIDYLSKAFSINKNITAIFDEIAQLKLVVQDLNWLEENYKKIGNPDIKEKVANFILDKLLSLKKEEALKESDKYSALVKNFFSLKIKEIKEKSLKLLFRIGDYEKIIELLKKDKNFFENSIAAKRFYLFSLFYNKDFKELLTLLKNNLIRGEDLSFTNYLLSRYYFALGCYRPSFYYLNRGELPSFISPRFLDIFSFDVKLSYYLESENIEKLETLLRNIPDLKTLLEPLKLKIFKAALLIDNKDLISRLKDSSKKTRIIYLIFLKADADRIKEVVGDNKTLVEFTIKSFIEYKQIEKIKKFINLYPASFFDKQYYSFVLGRYFEEKGKFKRAFNHFKKSAEENIERLKYLNYYVYFALVHNFKVKDIKDLIKKLEKSNSAGIQDTVGYYYYKNEDYKKAEYYFKEALSILSEDVEIKLHLADLYYKIENYRRAKVLYESVISKTSCPYKKFVRKQAYVLKKLKQLKKAVPKINSFQGLYSAKIYNNGKVSPFRIKVYYSDSGEFIFKLYHFPMTEFAEFFKKDEDNYVLINKKNKTFYIGKVDEILKKLINLKASEKELLYYLGIKYEPSFEQNNKIKVDSYEKGFPKKIEIKADSVFLKLKLIKYKLNLKKENITPDIKDFREVFSLEECLNGKD